MSVPHITYKVWEPAISRLTISTPNIVWTTLWRLDYCGAGEWELYEIYYQRRMYNADDRWYLKASGDVNSLSAWAKSFPTEQCNKSDRSFFRRLGIRLSGSYESRLQSLRASLINIGCGQQSTTEGGIGTSFVCTTDVTAYAELGNNGGIDVWARKTRAFSSESELVYCASDLTTMSQIEDALREEGIYPQCYKNQELLEMLDSIWTSATDLPADPDLM